MATKPSIRAQLIEIQTMLAQVIAQLPPDDSTPPKRRRRRGPRIVDPALLPGPKPSDADRAAVRRLLRR
jgi:hypothetical protein